MASVDSGVETGNESNDGPVDAKNETQVEQVLVPRLTILRDELTAQPICLFGAGHFKLPQSSLPAGFGESYPPVLPRFRSTDVKCQNPRSMLRRRSDWADWQWTDSLIERKLRIAVSTNNIEMVQNYLFAGVNPNCVDSMGRSPLHLAACSGYADIVRLLLENGANPNQRDRLGNTPLHLAACTNNIVVVTLLLKAGTDVCSSDLHGRSPLQLAQSKLQLLQKHCGGDGVAKNYVRNQAFQVSLPKLQLVAPIDEIPVYDKSFVASQALQIVEMMRLFLQKRGQEAEAELLSAFSSRLTLSETTEQVETQVQGLLDSLSGLSLESPCDDSAIKEHRNTRRNCRRNQEFKRFGRLALRGPKS